MDAREWLINYFKQIKLEMAVCGWRTIRAKQIWDYWKNLPFETALKTWHDNEINNKNPNCIVFLEEQQKRS